MNEDTQKVRQRLAETYKDKLQDSKKAESLKGDFLAKTEKEILIVSGLPRSGTSMMMQMLVSGGVEAFTDGIRQQDANNPKGYYEHEAIKKLAKDKRILKEINKEVVKVVAPLLQFLPLRYRYKIIFMERDIEEVLNSQKRMIHRLNPESKTNSKENLRKYRKLEQSYEQTIQKGKVLGFKISEC